MNRWLLALVLFLSFGHAKAVLPESGWYWNPQSSGSGFNIEVQDDKIFVAAFTYDSQGRSVFYTIGGVLNVNTGVLSSTLYVTSNGQCLGCPYNQPTTTAVAPAEVYFPTTRTARIRVFFPGATAEVSLVRFVFGYGTARAQEHLGTWSALNEILGVFFGEGLNMNALCTLPDLVNTFCGSRLGSTSSVAVGASVPGTNAFVILLDSSTSYYKRFIYTNDTNRWFGLTTTYLKSGAVPPIDSGSTFIANRLSGPSTANQIGISSDNNENVSLAADEFDAKQASYDMTKLKSDMDDLPPDTRSVIKSLSEDEIRRISAGLAAALSK
ncbi:MAG: hypothetical protein KA763_10095 [Xanthomonadales bacterium]|nr:hypothetical protein [Xanthomonadales bacterium]